MIITCWPIWQICDSLATYTDTISVSNKKNKPLVLLSYSKYFERKKQGLWVYLIPNR